MSSVTPSQLLARLKSHLHVSHEKVVRGPIQYSIITKVRPMYLCEDISL